MKRPHGPCATPPPVALRPRLAGARPPTRRSNARRRFATAPAPRQLDRPLAGDPPGASARQRCIFRACSFRQCFGPAAAARAIPPGRSCPRSRRPRCAVSLCQGPGLRTPPPTVLHCQGRCHHHDDVANDGHCSAGRSLLWQRCCHPSQRRRRPAQRDARELQARNPTQLSALAALAVLGRGGDRRQRRRPQSRRLRQRPMRPRMVEP